MNGLQAAAQDPTKRQALVSSLQALIDGEVKRTSGVSGLAIKGGYKVVSALRGGRMVPVAIQSLLDEFIAGFTPLIARFEEQKGAGFAQFLAKNERDAVSALLSVTDKRAQSANSVIQSTYKKLRPLAERQVANAIPRVGDVLAAYL